jgi:hypothetical protein
MGGGGGPGGFGILRDGAMLISIWATSSVVLRQSRAGQVHHTLSKARSASSSIGRWATRNPLVTFQ